LGTAFFNLDDMYQNRYVSSNGEWPLGSALKPFWRAYCPRFVLYGERLHGAFAPIHQEIAKNTATRFGPCSAQKAPDGGGLMARRKHMIREKQGTFWPVLR